MRIPKTALKTLLVTAVAAASAPLAIGVFAAQAKSPSSHATQPMHGSKLLIKASLAPSVTTDPNFHMVMPGAKPWVLRSGHVAIRGHRLFLRVRGLLIPNVGTGPVSQIKAVLYCGADTNTMPAASTGLVNLSKAGNAFIRDAHFATPSSCLAPQVMVIPYDPSKPMMYIAIDGR